MSLVPVEKRLGWTWWSTHRYADHLLVSVLSPANVTTPPPQPPGRPSLDWKRGAQPMRGVPRTCWCARAPLDFLPSIGTEIPDPPAAPEMKKEGPTPP